jgi:2-keto-4-pentenoate hydratase/2-oxohepta-3-ene-1,7-dioic acid hydratase in catechol pathway
MKLASFAVPTDVGRQHRVGVVREGVVYDVTASYTAVLDAESAGTPRRIAQAVAPPDLIAFLANGDRALDAAREGVAFVEDSETTVWGDGLRLSYGLSDIQLLSPLPRPNSIRDFMVFEEHVENSLGGDIPDVWYERPIYYKGNHNAVVHPGDTVDWPTYTDKLDYELELCAVIGKEGRDIERRDAEDYIAGYTIFNDFSARDIQLKEMAGKLGPTKGKDFANGFGPYLVTPDAISLDDLYVSAAVNGKTWSEGNTGDMYHSFPEIIEYVSMDETLYPGDVLGTGTVGNGCGLELDRWLAPGDTIELQAEGIGTLTHHISRER